MTNSVARDDYTGVDTMTSIFVTGYHSRDCGASEQWN